MNSRILEQLQRNFLASILQSNFSKSEIKEISLDLQTGGRLSIELGRMLSRYLELIVDRAQKQASSTEALGPDVLEMALEMSRSFNKKKSEIIELIGYVAPGRFKPKSLNVYGSVRGVLSHFVENASQSEIEKFLGLLASRSYEDPYLKGIGKGR